MYYTQRVPSFRVYVWLVLGLILFAGLVRQSPATQIAVQNDLDVSWQFVALVALGFFGAFRILLYKGKDFHWSLFLSGPGFFVYAVSIDALRNSGEQKALLIDCLHILLPVVAAVGLVSGMPRLGRERLYKGLLSILVFISAVYIAVSVLAYSVDFGRWVTPRIRYHENMSFARISGPLAGATSLCILFLPCIAICWQKLREPSERKWWYAIALGVFVAANLWTGSRLALLLLLLLCIFAMPARRWVVLAYCGVLLVLALNLGSEMLPEKWQRLGLSDPGRIVAMRTSLEAWGSSGEGMLVGVGSERLNILTKTVSQASRGQVQFNQWQTEFGSFPYGPHSIVWWSLGSYGVIGAVLRCAFLGALWFTFTRRILRLRWRGQGIPILPIAVALSSIGFLYDDSQIVYPYLMLVWYLFYLKALEELRKPVTKVWVS